MKYQYPMDVLFCTGSKYRATVSDDGLYLDFHDSETGVKYLRSHSVSGFEALLDSGSVEIISRAKIEPITLQVQIEGLEKAVALAKELEAVLGRLKIVVN